MTLERGDENELSDKGRGKWAHHGFTGSKEVHAEKG